MPHGLLAAARPVIGCEVFSVTAIGMRCDGARREERLRSAMISHRRGPYTEQCMPQLLKQGRSHSQSLCSRCAERPSTKQLLIPACPLVSGIAHTAIERVTMRRSRSLRSHLRWPQHRSRLNALNLLSLGEKVT